MKQILAAAVILLAGTNVILAAESSNQLQKTVLDLQFTAASQKPDVNQEIVFGPVHWISASTGVVSAQMWEVNTSIEFRKSPNAENFEMIHINPLEQGNTPQMWNRWRYRHAFTFSQTAGYTWNTFSEKTEPLNQTDGDFYEKFLKGVWTFWTIRRLPRHLKNSIVADNSDIHQIPPIFTEKITLQYDATGLKKPATMAFRIHIWNLPVMITFDVQPSTSTDHTLPLNFKYRWTYDMDNWRKLHGYRKDFWGYKWERDFPTEPALTEEQGKKLDDLLNRSVSFSIELVVQQLMIDLEKKFHSAVESAATHQ